MSNNDYPTISKHPSLPYSIPSPPHEFQEILDNDLSDSERQRLQERLDQVIQTSDRTDITLLAENLQDFLRNEDLNLAPESPQSWLHKTKELAKSRLSPFYLHSFLVGGLIAWSIWVMADSLRILVKFQNSPVYWKSSNHWCRALHSRPCISGSVYILIGLQAGTDFFFFSALPSVLPN
jgi:hypothetical protein